MEAASMEVEATSEMKETLEKLYLRFYISLGE